MKDINEKRIREKKIVGEMIELYCRKKHKSLKGVMCKECRELTEYAYQRIDKCPLMAGKTFCSNCRVHCYKPEMRDKIKQLMRYSGPRMLLYHPLMAVMHIIESKKEKGRLKKENGN